MIAMTFRLLAASVAISLLVACGGGGGVSSPQGGTENPPQTQPEVAERLPFPFAAAECDPRYAHIAGACGFDGAVDRAHFGISSVPAMRAQDSKHMPIYHDHDGSRRRMIVGVDQGTSHIGGLRSVTERGEFAVRHGTLQDGVGRGTVAAYLRDVIPSAVERYSSPPQIRIIGPSTASERQHVATAIQLVNTALPEEAKITMGTPLPTLSLRDTVNSDGINFRSGRELDNTIHIEFVPAGTFHSYPAATSWSWPSGHGGVRHSYVQFNKGANSYPRHPGQRGSSRQGTILLAHEIMHSLGIDGHASTHFDTIMEDTADIHLATQNGVQPLSLLWPVDREALRVLYGRLENGDSPADFGAWSSSALHVHGNGEHTGFGVALRNGYAEPYAYGHMQSPYSRLAEDATGGTATWNGNLVGPHAQPVCRRW